MGDAGKTASDTQEVVVRVDSAVAAEAEAVARANNFPSLSAALAAVARQITVDRRIPLDPEETRSTTERGRYSGASFSRLAALARQSGREAAAAALAAGRSASYVDKDGRVMRRLPNGSVEEVSPTR
jgi:antitoxin component of RelBE/YafQ-DinJ toxin-antitoxin module